MLDTDIAIVEGLNEIKKFCTNMRESNKCIECGYHRIVTTKMEQKTAGTSYQCGLGIPAEWDTEINV